MNKDIDAYNRSQADNDRSICEELAKHISKGLSNAKSKIWHGAPVWFLDGNPVVGYDKQKSSVRLLFWSGQSFDEPDLKPEGSFKAAEIHYTSIDQINVTDLNRWLKKSADIQWDYRNIVKRRGQLERLK